MQGSWLTLGAEPSFLHPWFRRELRNAQGSCSSDDTCLLHVATEAEAQAHWWSCSNPSTNDRVSLGRYLQNPFYS